MDKSWFDVYVITGSIILVLPQLGLFIVGVLARIESYVDEISWYKFSAKLSGIDVDFYLGLEGYVSDTSLTSSTFTSYDDQTLSFSQKCRDSGLLAVILTSIVVVASFVLLVVNIVRAISKVDSALMRSLSLFFASVTIGLGAGAYAYFYDQCVDKYRDYLDPITTDLKGSDDVGGICMITAILIGAVVFFMNLLLMVASSCGLCPIITEEYSPAPAAAGAV
jgi:multisubunit Na+/H+ antiporter MnhC subunit